MELYQEEGLNLLIGQQYLDPEEWILNGEKIAGGSKLTDLPMEPIPPSEEPLQGLLY